MPVPRRPGLPPLRFVQPRPPDADLDPALTYTIRVTVSDEDGGSSDIDTIINVDQEDARAQYVGP